MSLVQCSTNCRFQKDGYCDLNRIGRVTDMIQTQANGCLYFQKKSSKKGSQQD